MEDRGRTVEPWIKLVNTDSSGLDAYLAPSSVFGVVIDDKDTPVITLYTGGMMTPKKASPDSQLTEVAVVIRGTEATAVLAWLDRQTAVVIEAEWTRRPTS